MRRLVRPVAASVVLAVLSAVAVTGCGSTHPATTTTTGASSAAAERGHFTIGLSVLQLANPVFEQEYQDLRTIGRRLGFAVNVVDANFSPETQLQQLDAMLNTGAVQALMIDPVDPHALLSVLALAAARHVPVVFGNQLPAGVHYPLLVSLNTNWAQYGAQAGRSLVNCINTRLKGRAQVALLEGPPLPGTIVTARIAAERAAIATVPGAKIVADVVGTPDEVSAVSAFAAILQAHPGVNAVTGVNDELMLGVAEAFRQAGIDPRKVCIQGLDDIAQGQAAVESGEFWGDVTLPQSVVAAIAARVLTSLVRDPRSPYRSHGPVFVPTKVVQTSRFR